ncbi:hypothetical protein YSA_04541 [Pseudomonas putida ND6]|uniref:Uncharacterized protein n=1 Tax=Pseudomonas putida ND6 TaxID=231023 RepID=I3UUR1_PSEPU|nr:hypothetical protein YSA_04541 [Pseudomonas putida ND6]
MSRCAEYAAKVKGLTDINTPHMAARHDVLCMTARMQNDEPIRP